MADAQPKQQKPKGSKPQKENQKPVEQQANANAPEQKQPKQNQKPKNENKKADAENKKPEVNKEQTNNKENSKQEKPQVPPSKEEETPASAEPQTNDNSATSSSTQTNAKEKKPKAPKKEAVTGKGQVKAVPSGDTVIVIQLEKNRPPVERKITLSHIRAPKLGLRTFNEKKEDEDFAWQSREFLRKLTIEKPVSYTIEGSSKDGSRDFGLVHLLDKEGKTQDVAALLVADGWAEVTVKPEENQTTNRPDVEELFRLQEKAKSDNKGQWNKNFKKDKKRPIVEINSIPEVYERLKGHPQHGIVENVLNGNTVIITIVPQFYDIKLSLSGVECPGYQDDGSWEPFGREARFTTEFLLLHRDVQVIFEGADKFNLYGSLNYHGRNVSEELLRRGLGKYVDWSGTKTAFKDKIKAAEKQAVEHKAGIWSKEQPVQKAEDKKGWKPGKELHGKVVEVVSAGTVVVEDTGKHKHRITLSSIRSLRGGSLVLSKDEEKKETEEGTQKEKSEKELQKEKKHRAEFLEKTYAHEGKEYLRKRLIGQKVRCVLDYSRPPLPSNENKEEKGKKEEDKLYWSVYFEKNNVAVEVVANGFAKAADHRAGDLRSKDYEDILKAEHIALKSHRGLHTPDDRAAITYINDASSDPAKARKFLTSLKRGKQRGVVEYIAHASRFKLYVPKESCELFISISGIKTPRNSKEKFFQESLDFVKEKLHQRDVEFEVLNVDKGGNFLGTIWFNRENIATLLLTEGFATIMKASARDLDYFNDYRTAEDIAKRGKRHLWEGYDEEAEKAAYQKRRQEQESNRNSGQELIDVIVTEIIDATKFYVQVVGKEAEKLEELMKQLAAQDTGSEGYDSKFGEYVLAQFTADDAWYRAKNVGESNGQVKVFYIDYGNSETIPKSRVRKLPEEFDTKKLAAQASEAHLAYVKPPALNQDYGHEAAEFFKELVEGKTLYASVESREGNVMSLTMGDNSNLFVNAAIVRAGLARVERVRGAREAIGKLKAEEEKARLSHNYIWEYGDPGSDDEDEPLRPSSKQAKAPPKKKAEEIKKDGKEEKKDKE